jgi:hypothetical protein
MLYVADVVLYFTIPMVGAACGLEGYIWNTSKIKAVINGGSS